MQSKNRVVKGSKVPSINLSKEILSLLIRLENSELKEIMVGIRDYVYKDKEPSVSEDVEDIMDMVLDNVNYIASKHLNGKKGGRTKNNNTDIEPNTEFDTEAKISPNQPDLATNGTDVPQEGESLPEAKIEAKEEEIIIDTDNTEDMGTLIGTLSNFATAETRRIEHEEDRSMEHMMKCLSTFDINKAKHQVSKSKTIDDNMKRVANCLDPLLVEFNKTERFKLYISIIEEVLNSKKTIWFFKK